MRHYPALLHTLLILFCSSVFCLANIPKPQTPATKGKNEDPLTAQDKRSNREQQKVKQKTDYDTHIDQIKIKHNEEIVFGQSAFLSGGFKIYGKIIQNAIRARFLRVNSEGGIQGKMLRLVTLDDHGEPLTARKNIEAMMKKHKIDMFFGNMGTRNILAVKPLIEQGKIAMLFPWGGNEELRDPDLSYIINGLGLVKHQIEALVEHVVESLRLRKIAIFHSDGDFGKQNAQFAIEALEQFELRPAAIGSYNRFTMSIVKTADELIKADPKIVLCMSTSMPAVKLINHFFETGYYGTQFLGIDSTFLVSEILKARGIPFRYASYVPDPIKSDYQIAQEYRHDISRFFPRDRPTILGLAYYIHSAIIIEALQQIKDEITKEKIIGKIENMHQTDIGGFLVDFDKGTRHAYPLQTTIIKG